MEITEKRAHNRSADVFGSADRKANAIAVHGSDQSIIGQEPEQPGLRDLQCDKGFHRRSSRGLCPARTVQPQAVDLKAELGRVGEG